MKRLPCRFRYIVRRDCLIERRLGIGRQLAEVGLYGVEYRLSAHQRFVTGGVKLIERTRRQRLWFGIVGASDQHQQGQKDRDYFQLSHTYPLSRILSGARDHAVNRGFRDAGTSYYLLVSASTPGSFLPSRNSSDAPPPVEMWEILSATPAALTAATLSPPPTIEVAAPLSATASAIFLVPLANASISKTPIGPFHTMVRALPISVQNNSIDLGPMSSAIMSAGIACPSPMC